VGAAATRLWIFFIVADRGLTPTAKTNLALRALLTIASPKIREGRTAARIEET